MKFLFFALFCLLAVSTSPYQLSWDLSDGALSFFEVPERYQIRHFVEMYNKYHSRWTDKPQPNGKHILTPTIGVLT